MRGKRRGKMSYERKKSLVGYGFIGFWLVGFFLVYARPLVQSLLYSFRELKISVGGFESRRIGLENFRIAFTEDSEFVPLLVETVKDLLYQVPLILVFSLIMALLLNEKFRGRTVARAVFFLPVIIASGVIIDIINGDYMSKMILSGEKTSQLFQVTALNDLLQGLGIGSGVIGVIVNTSNDIFELSWRSGIQILLFLAGLQAVPGTLYEAASIDGATRWEMFWKVTFPMLSPMLMVNLIYSITDSFTSYSNPVMRLIVSTVQEKMKFAYSSALAWVYFAVIGAILAIVFLIISRKIVYVD